MANCPNKNLESWKNLVASRGEDLAYYLWDKYDGNVPESESKESIVKAGLKATSILQSPKAEQFFNSVGKNKISGEFFWKKMQADLGIPKEQIDLMKSFNTENKDELISSLLANYSYVIEINTAKERTDTIKPYQDFSFNNDLYTTHHKNVYREYYKNNTQITKEEYDKAFKEFRSNKPTQYYSNLTVPGGTNYTEQEIATPAITPSIKGHAQFATDQGIGWFRTDDKVSENVEVENRYEYYGYEAGDERAGDVVEGTRQDLIVPKDKFTYNGDTYERREPLFDEEDFGTISYFKNGKSITGKEFNEVFDAINQPTKIRRILEVQSDLFQKGRDKENLEKVNKRKVTQEDIDSGNLLPDVGVGDLISDYETITKGNQFLQLLNKNNNWVTFFVKSIIQDSSKKGYEKVLFPSGNTASKIEGHSTLEEFKKQQQDRLEGLTDRKNNLKIIEREDKTYKWGLDSDGIVTRYLTKEDAQSEMDSQKQSLDREINNVKQELERVEKEGFGALKPIYKFYEENVTNVLKKQGYNPKQITDEYGNTWNEIEIVPEREAKPILLQKEEMPSSKASSETLQAVKTFLKQIGVNVEEVNKIVVNGIKLDANAIAQVTQALVQVVEGKEASALPEEAMHFAVEIIKQKNPKLYNRLLKEINDFKIYDDVLALYGRDKAYQGPDGKPDIRKLKDEAIGKVLAETIIKSEEGFTERPELLEKREKVQSWWRDILDFIKSLFTSSGFDQAAMSVLSGEFKGTVEDIRAKDGEYYLQQNPNSQAAIISNIKETAKTISKLPNQKGYSVNGVEVLNRVSNIAKTWYERMFEDKKLTESDYDRAVADLKAEEGTEKHDYIDHMIKNHFTDADGKFIINESDRPSDQDFINNLTPANAELYGYLKANLEQRLQWFVGKYGKDTVFLSETPVYNPKRGKSGDIVGTIDFLAITPDNTPNPKDAAKVHILDWKFVDLNVDNYQDIPWYKVLAWNLQMEEYKSILKNAYNVKFDGSEQTSMIPIRAIYSRGIAKERVLPQLIDLEIGNVDVMKEEKAYLLPVGLKEQTTGQEKLDSLIFKLNSIYKTISEKPVTQDQKANKAEQLNALYSMIRQVQVRQNLKPLINQAAIFNKEIERLITEYNTIFKGVDAKSLDEKTKNEFSAKIMSYEASLNVYANLTKDLSYLKADKSEEGKEFWNELRDVTETAQELMVDLEKVKNEFAVEVVAKSYKVLDYLTPEKIVKGFNKWFNTTSQLQTKGTELVYKMANRMLTFAAQDVQSQGEILKTLKENYTNWANSKGISAKNYFDILKKKDKNELIDQYNSDFYKELKKKTTKGTSDFNWIQENIDVPAYIQHIKELKNKEIERIERNTIGKTDDETNRLISIKKAEAEKLYNTSTTESPAWLLYNEIKKFPNKNKWESAEWKELHKKDSAGNYVNKPAVDFYNYIVERNKHFESIKYLNPKVTRTFLPFVRKSLMEKIVLRGDVKLGEDLLRQVTVSEGDVGYGEIDPLTKQPVYNIPKYFTRDTKEEVSEDLFRNMTLLNEMAIRYEYLSDVEAQMNLMASIESKKEAVKTSYFGKTKYKPNGDVETTSDNTENTQLMRDMIEAIVYGHKFVENENFDLILGNLAGFGKKLNEKLGINVFPEQFDDAQISLNKTITQLNNFFQIKTLGLNPISALSNFLGGSFQSVINAGVYFTKTEFAANEFLLSGKLKGADAAKYIGALKYFLPLTDNFNTKLAKELSLNKLSQEGIQDFMMIFMRSGDQYVQSVNFFSYLDNTIVENGQLVNAREFLRKSPEYTNIYNVSGEVRRQLEKQFEEDVKKLVEQKGVLKLATVQGNELVIPGVDRKSDSVIELRRKVQSLTKDALGNLTEDDLRKINLNIYGKSFMIFKNWIPRLVDVRFGNIKYNAATEAYEWGRTRMLFNMLSSDLLRSIDSLTSALGGNDEKFVAQIKELYEKKRESYKRETNKELNMTEAEFIDLVRRNVKNQMTDFLFYATLMSLFFGLKAMAPDDDDERAKNAHKFLMRVADKITDEVGYFYNPTSILSLVSTGIFPSMSYLDNLKKVVINSGKEMYALGVGDEKAADKNYVLKYLLKGAPITSQADAILLLFFPDLAKDLGMKAQSQSRPIGK